MALYKRGNIYWYNFEFRGETHQGSTKCRNRREAEAVERKRRSDLALGIFGLNPAKLAPVFEVFANGAFTREIDTQVRAAKTRTFYKEKIRRLLEYRPLAAARLHHIQGELINDYIHYRQKTVSKSSINRELTTLRKALRKAQEWELIDRVPKIRIRTRDEKGRDFVLSQDQEHVYLESIRQPLLDLAILMLDTGLRVGEAVSLPWTGVSLQPAHGAQLGYVSIGEGKTPNATRIVPLTERVAAMLANRRRFFPEAVWVFPGQRKGRHLTVWGVDNMHRDVRQAVRTEDGELYFPEEFVVHSLRHTFGTRLGESGADAYAIMKLMGHATIAQSQTYVHPTPVWKESAIQGLDRMNAVLRGKTAESEVKGPYKIHYSGDGKKP